MVTKVIRDEFRRKLKIRLLEIGMTQRRLAAKLGYSHGYLRLVIVGSKTSPKARRAIEGAVQAPIWSDPIEFEHRSTESTATVEEAKQARTEKSRES